MRILKLFVLFFLFANASNAQTGLTVNNIIYYDDASNKMEFFSDPIHTWPQKPLRTWTFKKNGFLAGTLEEISRTESEILLSFKNNNATYRFEIQNKKAFYKTTSSYETLIGVNLVCTGVNPAIGSSSITGLNITEVVTYGNIIIKQIGNKKWQFIEGSF